MDLEKFDKICAMLRSKMSDEEYAEVENMLKGEVKDSAKRGMDSALRPYANCAVRSVARYNQAVQKCSPVLGSVPMACDSAEAVYGHALNKLGMDVSRVAPSNYEWLFDNLSRRSSGEGVPMSARDKAAATAKFPGLARFMEGTK